VDGLGLALFDGKAIKTEIRKKTYRWKAKQEARQLRNVGMMDEGWKG
jgi:hypothetical protein